MKRYVYGFLAICFLVEATIGQGQVSQDIQARLLSERASLDQVISEIDSEKQDVLRELEQVENSLRNTGRKWDLITARNHSLSDPSLQAPLREQIDSVYQALGHLQQLNLNLPEYLHPAEAGLEARRNAQAVPSLTLGDEVIASDDSLQIQIQLMDEAIARLENLAGGHVFDSEALDDDGGWSAGRIWILGPVAFFEPAEKGKLAWINHVSGKRPATADLVPPGQDGLRAAFAGRSGAIPLPADPEMPYQPKTGLSGLAAEVAKGGIWIIPILGFAFIATVSAIFKWLELRRYKLPTEADLRHAVLESRDKLSIASWCQPVRHLVLKGLHLQDSGDPKLETKLVREVYLLHPELTRFLSFIAITASVAPLLGLLGTVSGMIETFDVISVHGTRNAQMLSGGISEALITTEFGLIVAIPALVMHTLLNRRIRRLMSQLEHMARSLAEMCAKGRAG